MKRVLAVVLVAAVLAGCGGGGAGGTAGGGGVPNATCAGPYIDTRPSVGRAGPATPRPLVAGETVTFYGHAYFADCYDTGQEGTPPPIETVVLIVEMPDGQRTELDPVHPDANGSFSVEIPIPADTEAGTLRIFDDHGDGVDRGTEFTVESAHASGSQSGTD